MTRRESPRRAGTAAATFTAPSRWGGANCKFVAAGNSTSAAALGAQLQRALGHTGFPWVVSKLSTFRANSREAVFVLIRPAELV